MDVIVSHGYGIMVYLYRWIITWYLEKIYKGPTYICGQKNLPTSNSIMPDSKKNRPSYVCDNCKLRKQKCDKLRPKCTRCIRSGKECVYSDSGRPVKPNTRSRDAPNTVNVIQQEPAPKVKSKGTKVGFVSKPNKEKSRFSQTSPIDSSIIQEQIVEGFESSSPMVAPESSNNKESEILGSQYPPNSGIISNTPSSTGVHSNSIMSNHPSPYDSSRTGTSSSNFIPSKPDEIPEDNDTWNYLEDQTLELFNPRNMIVVYGSVSYVDAPFAVHSLVQRDSFASALTGAIHGNVMMELHSKLMKCPQSQSYLEALQKLQPPTPINQSEHDVSALPFVQTSMIRWIEDKENREEITASIGFASKTINLDESMSPKLCAGLQLLVYEIESTFLTVPEINYIFKKFYEDIYPFYPFMEIPTLESNLSKIMTELPNGRYKFNVIDKSCIQTNFEQLTLFTLIITISFRRLHIVKDLDFLVTKDADTVLKSLYSLCHKLMSLLDSFKNTNENSFCCELYSYVLTYLEPNTEILSFLHDKILRLKCLYEIAITLGLHHDPSKFTRYFNEIEPDPAILNLRRKLWIGVNNLKLTVTIPHGVANVVEHEHLKAFLGPENNMTKVLQNNMMPLTLFDSSISQILEDKYKFQIILNRLVTSCTPISNISKLSDILENMKRTKTFMFHTFSLINMENQLKKDDPYVTSRGAILNITEVKNTEILLANINGQSTVMCVNFVLANYFEEKCAQDWKQYESYYHKFLFDAVESCSELNLLITNYLEDKFAESIPLGHKYIIDRVISNTVIRLWVIQSCYLTRFSYKLDQLDRQIKGGLVSKWNDSEIKNSAYIENIMSNICNQMEHLIGLMERKVSREYFSSNYCSPMFNYVLHLVNSKKLVHVVNNFWNRTFQTADVPSLILKNVNMKWGLDMKNPQLIGRYLNDPEVLGAMTGRLLKKISDMLSTLSPSSEIATNNDNNYIPKADKTTEEPQILDNFLESNFDLFLGIINNSLGDLPKL